MQKSNFYIEVEKNQNSENLSKVIIKNAYNEVFKSDKSQSQIFISLCDDLKELNLLNKINIKSIILGLRKAIMKDEEEKLFDLLYESEKLRKQILNAGRNLKDESYKNLKQLEEEISKFDLDKKELLMSSINEALIDATISADIIKEVSQNVFVSIIESAEDVEEMAYEFSKNLAYRSIIEDEFRQIKILEISKTIVSQSLNVANISQIYSNELISGTVNGVNDGIIKAIEKFKDEFKFAPDEIAIKFHEMEKELSSLDEEFVLMLKNLVHNSEDPAKSILSEILKKEYESYVARMKKLSNDTISQLKEKISEMEIAENYKELLTKFEEIKKEIASKSAKLIDDFELNQKFEVIKKELEENKFFNKFKKNNNTKELSDRAYTASKDIVNENKEKNN